MKQLMRVNLALGLWLMISPFVLVVFTGRAFSAGWEDFLLGFGIATFSLCRVTSSTGAELWDLLIMSLSVTTLLNPVLFHYLNVRAVAFNNLIIGSMVSILVLCAARRLPNDGRKIGVNRDGTGGS